MPPRNQARRRPGRPATTEITAAQRRTFDAVRDYIDEHGVAPTLSELCDHLNLSSTAVHESLRQLERKGYLEREKYSRRGLQVLRNLPGRRPSGLVSIPLVGMVAAGLPRVADEHLLGEAVVPARFVEGDECFALKVHGDSMQGAGLKDGDTVIVRPQPLARHGDIVVAFVDGEATMKRLHWVDPVIELRPENKRFKPIPITAETRFEIVGKVVSQSSQWK